MTTNEGIDGIIEATDISENTIDDEFKKNEFIINRAIVRVSDLWMKKRKDYEGDVSLRRKSLRVTGDFLYEAFLIGDSTRLTQEKAAKKRGKPAWHFTVKNRCGSVVFSLTQYFLLGLFAGGIENNYTGAETAMETASFHGFMGIAYVESVLAIATGILAYTTKKAYPGITFKSAIQNVPTYIKRGYNYLMERTPENVKANVNYIGSQAYNNVPALFDYAKLMN